MGKNRLKLEFCLEQHRDFHALRHNKRAFFVRHWLPLTDYSVTKGVQTREEGWENWCGNFLSSNDPEHNQKRQSIYVDALCELLDISKTQWLETDLESFKVGVLERYIRLGLNYRAGSDVEYRLTFGWERLSHLAGEAMPGFEIFQANVSRLGAPETVYRRDLPKFSEWDKVQLRLEIVENSKLLLLHRDPRENVHVLAPSPFVPETRLKGGSLLLPTHQPEGISYKAFSVRRPLGVHQLCAILVTTEVADVLPVVPLRHVREGPVRLGELALGELVGALEQLTSRQLSIRMIAYEVDP